MSASTHIPQTSRPHSLRFDDLLSVGRGTLLAVAFAGFTLGFFAWYALVVPRHDPALSNLALFFAVVAGPIVTVTLWIGYARYFSRRAGITLS
ncbi:MAG TPA: hypothetical protein VFE36_13755, partial [Candidatus Baltobacteraceae bacterium]|nr:hypothetical protein [Candidatus Baltobacteraceae bacterium]